MIVELRLSDNVLGDDDWTVRRMTLHEGVVVSVEDLPGGAYDHNQMPGIGATVADIDKWLSFDPTGFHPEIYHDIRECWGDRAAWECGPGAKIVWPDGWGKK